MNEEVSRDMTGGADGKNQVVDSTDGVIYAVFQILHLKKVCNS